MSQAFKDSFDTGLTVAQTRDNKWDGAVGFDVADIAIGTTYGRNGTSGIMLPGATATTVPHVTLNKNVPSLSEYGVAFAFRLSEITTGGERPILSFRNATGTQLNVYWLADGTIRVRRGGGGTILGTSTAAFSQTTMRHMEVRAVINDTTGSIQIRVLGQIILDLTNVDTQNQASSDITIIGFGSDLANALTGTTGNKDLYLDDVIIWDTSGTKHNSWHGDRRIYVLLPNAAGDSSQFTPTSGANYTNVDDAAPDGDTTVVASGTVGHIDLYGFADLPTTALAIGAVTVNHWARKDDAGDRAIAAKIKLSGTTATGADKALTSGFVNVQTHFSVDPAGADWTRPNVNALQAGQEIRT